MGRASQASSVAGPDRSYYLTKRTELWKLIMHAFKEPEVLGKITCSKEGFTINQDDKESKKLAARGNLHNSNKNDFTKGFHVRYNNKNSNTLYPNPFFLFIFHLSSVQGTAHWWLRRTSHYTPSNAYYVTATTSFATILLYNVNSIIYYIYIYKKIRTLLNICSSLICNLYTSWVIIDTNRYQ